MFPASKGTFPYWDPGARADLLTIEAEDPAGEHAARLHALEQDPVAVARQRPAVGKAS